MNNINYIKADLVKLDIASRLDSQIYKLHACNCLGRWGRGIAKAFAESYPASYKEYDRFCTSNGAANIDVLGEAFITSENIICLMTSRGYSPPDPEISIIGATARALSELGAMLPDKRPVWIYSNRFNSGLFKVDWDQTERLIDAFLKAFPNVTWTVCDPEEKL